MAAHENYGIFSSKLLLKELKVRYDMQAIDAAVGPKVDQSQFAFEITLNRQRRRVKPNVVRGELLCPHLADLFLW